MEWVPQNDSQQSSQSSQSSQKSKNNNPEAQLTAEEKNEMKETLDKAEEHMEQTMIASYTALVIGCIIRGNRSNAQTIKQYMKEDTFTIMIAVLKKFQTFMALTAVISKKGEKTLSEILEELEEVERVN